MVNSKSIINTVKRFKPTNWVLNNATATYFLTIILTLVGILIFVNLPKERFPDIVVPQIYITTIYAGNAPKDIENLITRPLEKQLNTIEGSAHIKKITSNSLQDYSTILVEFETDVPVSQALDKVKDAVDKAHPDLPSDLTKEPAIKEVNFSDIPVMFINISGNKTGLTLKKYAEIIKDKIELLPEISKVEMVGAPNQIIQIDIDKYKLEYGQLSLRDVENAIKRENMNIGLGSLEMGSLKRSVYIKGEFTDLKDIEDIVIKNLFGATIYLRDIATIREGIEDTTSYSRAYGTNVITLNIVKKAGQNLLFTSDKITKIINEIKEKNIPSDVKVDITGDQSEQTRNSFNELINAIVFGFILVLFILMFFMGVSTAFFVALSVPLSIFITFCCLPLGNSIVGTNITLNFIVLFALLFALGIIVDDAIVVIENTHRLFNNGKIPILQATKNAAGEVFLPVLSGTLTTLAPFFPLLFWKGIVGKFMIYLPVILIFTLTASLIVAFLINPVFAVSFMKPEKRLGATEKKRFLKSPFFIFSLFIGFLLNMFGQPLWGNLLLGMLLFLLLNKLWLHNIIYHFQHRLLPKIMNIYEHLLRWVLQKNRPPMFLAALFLLFIISVVVIFVRVPANKIFFFPYNDNPNKIFVYLKLPVGTNLHYTDSITKILEQRTFEIFKDKKYLVQSVIANVAAGATDPNSGDRSVQSNRSMVQISFVDNRFRDVKTDIYLEKLRQAFEGIVGAEISVEPENTGPPTGAPINIEISGDNFDDLVRTALAVKKQIIALPGIEELRLDTDLQMPEILLSVDRRKANIMGLNTAQIGSEIRTALFGKEVTQYKYLEESYPIVVRFKKEQRENIDNLLNTYTVYRDNAGKPVAVPFSSFIHIDYTSTYGIIKRKNLKRTITLFSNVLKGYSATSVNLAIENTLKTFKNPMQGVTIQQTGETEEQRSTNRFLLLALLAALLLMLAILIIQFNSISKPIIVLTEIFFSVIGVLLGFGLTKMAIPTIMLGVGMIGLAGIVVKNAILLIEFTDELRNRGYRTKEAVIRAGKARIIPVLLTMLATVLGLVPLAIGLNIDFYGLLTELNPHLFFGGDSVIFWGPLSWTIIFGLVFSFFLTLVLIPSMYIMAVRLKRPLLQFYKTKWIALVGILGPVFFLLVLWVYWVRKLQGKKMFPRLLGQ